MRINTNISSLNAYRNLTETNKSVSSSMEKLSSGFRINRAADDAAGLGIANRLRADTRALSQAAKNAEQANSVLQIAEGGASTIQKMLERMKELATQAGSDSVDVAGRARIQAEFTELQAEITRTVDTTKFQGGHLLKTVAAADAVDASVFAAASDNMTAGGSNTGTGDVTLNGTFSGAADATINVQHDGTNFQYRVGSTGSWTNFSGNTAVVSGVTIDVSGVSGAADGDTWSVAATAAADAVEASGGTRSFLVGSSEQYDGADSLTISGFDLTLGTLGIDGDSLATLDGARTALSNIDDAMATVATTLGNIGAAQNRIEYAVSNLKTSIQNFTAAESAIRDVDMAEEMTKFSKNNILAQAGTAMLAQANQSAQGVLQLLRG